MTWLENLVRPDLLKAAAYSSARSESEGFLPDISIDANEFPWPPFGFASEACALNRYPEAQPQKVLDRLSALWNIPAEHILLSRGSDEGIDVLIRLLCSAEKDQILICPPTYGMYQVAAVIQGAKIIKAPLKENGQLNVRSILKNCAPQTKLVFIPSPNAPMGHLMRRKDILALCAARQKKSLIVVDEAYIEFSDAPSGMLPDLKKTPNLVVLRTLSKAHALAGERVGAVIASKQVVRLLAKIIAPYPLAQTSIKSALDALSANGLAHNAARRRLIVSERKRMARLLPKSLFIESVYPSEANFLLARTTSAKKTMQRLKSFGILARDRSGEIADSVRFSIGTPEENDLVLGALGVEIAGKDDPNERLYSLRRATKETEVNVTVNLDNANLIHIQTGIGFFDHMLEQIAKHGGFGLVLNCQGDLRVDPHHTIEDCALALGKALQKALGDKCGLGRYGFFAPLDEALAQAVIDLSGRPFFKMTGKFPAAFAGEMPSDMVPHFFQSFANALKATMHMSVQGTNTHHMIEALFKAAGRVLRQALRREGKAFPSTKGAL